MGNQTRKKHAQQPLQKELDKFGVQIQNFLKPAEKFNKWLDKNGQGSWFEKLAIFLGKLPFELYVIYFDLFIAS